MATSKLILDKRRKLKDETIPICIMIYHHRKPLRISTGFSVLEEQWDAKNQVIISKSKKVKDLKRTNNRLSSRRIEIDDQLDSLNLSGKLASLSPSELQHLLSNKSIKVSFNDFTQKIIDELTLAKRLGNASVYQQAKDFIKRYTNERVLSFAEINYSLLKSIESKHLAEGNGLNSLSFYFRTVRAIFNRAIKEGIIDKDSYAFANYSIRETKTAKRAISKIDIDKIRDEKFEHGTPVWHARNYFLFSFYNMGMNFADIAMLKPSNIINDRIVYKRAKTGRNYSIKLSPPVNEILRHYLPDKGPEDFIFPIITRDTLVLQMQDRQNQRKIYNKNLKKIASKCTIGGNLTGYVARHSWATIAKDLNVPISVISEGLGHEDIKTTQIYLDSFDDDVIDDANKLIIS